MILIFYTPWMVRFKPYSFVQNCRYQNHYFLWCWVSYTANLFPVGNTGFPCVPFAKQGLPVHITGNPATGTGFPCNRTKSVSVAGIPCDRYRAALLLSQVFPVTSLYPCKHLQCRAFTDSEVTHFWVKLDNQKMLLTKVVTHASVIKKIRKNPKKSRKKQKNKF